MTKLGHHLEICFSVKNMTESIEFYSRLGFKIYTGGSDKGWCTMTREGVYIAMFPDKFIDKEFNVPILLNFRGGNLSKIVPQLENQGIKFTKQNVKGDGTGDAIFVDPDGIKFYIDTSLNEERVNVE